MPEATTRIAIQPTILGILGVSQCTAAIADAQTRLKARGDTADVASHDIDRAISQQIVERPHAS